MNERSAKIYNHFLQGKNDPNPNTRDSGFNYVLNLFNNQPLNILEIGCLRCLDEGKGEYTRGSDGWSSLFWAEYIQKNGGSLTVCDIIPQNIENCKIALGNFIENGLNIKFIIGDGNKQDFSGYDLIYLDGSDDPNETLMMFEKIDRTKSVTFFDDFVSKGSLVERKYPDCIRVHQNKGMGLYLKR